MGQKPRRRDAGYGPVPLWGFAGLSDSATYKVRTKNRLQILPMIILAQSVDNVAAEWIKNAALFLAAVAATGYYIKEIFFKKQADISPQPLLVKLEKGLNETLEEIKREVHENFASRDAFENHVRENTARHSQLFSRIESTGKEHRMELDRRFEELQMERSRTLKDIHENFTTIREDLASIKTELRIRNE